MNDQTVDWDERRRKARRTAVILGVVAVVILVSFVVMRIVPEL